MLGIAAWAGAWLRVLGFAVYSNTAALLPVCRLVPC